MQPGTVEAVYPLDAGQAVILTWPQDLDPQELEDVESWMKMMVRKMKRSVGGLERQKPDSEILAEHEASVTGKPRDYEH